MNPILLQIIFGFGGILIGSGISIGIICIFYKIKNH
ncbi:hypothetical protein LCGC14_1513300 [marine sediment metagenome]|uniref:Uncharacterized protein n=1 Tax=marine sediment metagenome TaxID=412755 RepID=A0A0F9M1V3_9ZZZZ